MTGLIFDIKHFAVHDGPGIRTTVFFSGCPLNCLWCHNPEGLKRKIRLGFFADKCVGCGKCAEICPTGAQKLCEGAHELLRDKCVACGECAKVCPVGALTIFGKRVEVDEVVADVLEDRDFYETSNGGVTLSGGECTSQPEFCEELLRKFKAEGLHTAVDTCGYVAREVLERIIPYTDLFLYDIKAIDSEVHRRCTGVTNERILENLRYLDSRGCELEVRIPYIPEHNSGELEKISEFLKSLSRMPRVRILPYHDYSGSKFEALGMVNTLPRVELPSDAEIESLTERYF